MANDDAVEARKALTRGRWGRVEHALRWWADRGSPGAWPFVRGREGFWVLLRLLLLGVALCGAAHQWYVPAMVGVSTLLGADLLVANTSIVLRRDPRPINVLRSHVLTFIGYVSLPLVFSPYWLWLLDFPGTPFCRSVDATWQSIRTLTTTGPDVTLTSGARVLAGAETFVGIYFLVTIIATYVSWWKEGPVG